MIQVVGLRHDIKIEVREKLSINPKHCEEALNKLLGICEEVVIVSTCNRCEIYFNANEEKKDTIEEIFKVLKWDTALIKYISHKKGREAIEHLMEVVCGFDSIVLGEDQILGQVKSAYESAVNTNAVKGDLQRLFQSAITCGKEFRHKSELYKIPVSSSSIAVKVAREEGVKSFMLLGFGEVGELTSKYILSSEFDVLYIAVRNAEAVSIKEEKVKIIPFAEREKYYKEVDCIISCTSAPHIVIKSNELPDKKFLIFDLAVPRDVEEAVGELEKVTVYDIDEIGAMNDENHKRRNKLMIKNKYILHECTEEFLNWQKWREISGCIKQIKLSGEEAYKKRVETFKNKGDTKDKNVLAEVLLKSTSDVFVNRAIEVLKQEHLKGRGEECMKIIEKIFFVQN